MKCLGSHQCLNNLLEIERMIGLLYRDEAYALIIFVTTVMQYTTIQMFTVILSTFCKSHEEAHI